MEDCKNYISRRGYTINKVSLTPRREQKLRKDLNIQPFEKQRYIMEKFGNLPESFKIYLESANKFYVPKFYGIEHFGEAIDKVGDAGDNINLSFNGDLRNDQKNIMNDFLPIFRKNKGGILNIKTGGGKTAMALYIISLLKKKTLVIVHKSFLMDQWIERISQFLPKSKIGIIQSTKIKVENCDIVIGMLQSISQRNYPSDTFTSFGLIVTDEVHSIATNQYSRVFPKISSQYNLGLSATINRKDGTEKILYWNIGPVYAPTQCKTSFGEVKVYMLSFSDSLYQQTYYNSKGNANLPKMINKLVESPNREELILKLLVYFHNLGRKTLLLTERRSQIESLNKKLIAMKISNGKCVGGTKTEILEHSVKQPILLATYSYVQEGFDVSDLNTLIFASPKSDIIQASGRILRQTPEERKYIPIIIDIVDETVSMKKKSELRKKYYKKSNFTILNSDINSIKDQIKT